VGVVRGGRRKGAEEAKLVSPQAEEGEPRGKKSIKREWGWRDSI